jgi:hypothetical protein
LDEFLVTTGIEFLPTKILPSEKKIVESGQLEDQVRVYQEECYVHGCDELEKTIEQLQTTINGFRQDMDENPPLLFDEFAQGTILEREEIVSNLNRSKEYCLLEARADWYPWKQMLFDRMFKNLDVHYEKLEQDYQVVAPLLEQFKQVGVAAKGYLDEVVTNIDIVQQEYEAKVEELAQAKVLLTTEKEERRLLLLI